MTESVSKLCVRGNTRSDGMPIWTINKYLMLVFHKISYTAGALRMLSIDLGFDVPLDAKVRVSALGKSENFFKC